ncbi:hypothetical protein B0H21DRAFT_777191 [Amylocystis lapponica]|nr:hypothetical protein B0H21DRAFT_777191 [Amylocystis lapponica]
MQLGRYGIRHLHLKNTLGQSILRSRRVHGQADLLDDLRSRGLVSDITRPDALQAEIRRQPQVVYAGIDPTAKSLHVGHLLPLLCLLHFQIRGHQIIPLIGGATGLIGDPSGRSTERPLSEQAVIEDNVVNLTAAVQRFYSRAYEYAQKRSEGPAESVRAPDVRNNIHWLKDLNLLEFLRTVGFHSRVNTMLARDSVRARLESQQGISFTEFTYQLLQSYDFLTLHKTAGCSIQIGGSDQWGNIVAGIDLINRVNATAGSESSTEKGFGIVTPLLTTASGEKFGKSAGNAVSLDEQITNVFDFYQFFLRTTDADVGRYLKMFTLLPMSAIDDVLESHMRSPEARTAQHLLAQEVTELVHGDVGLRRAQAATAVIFDNDYVTAKAETIIDAMRGTHFSTCAARQLVAAKGLYLNNQPVASPQQTIGPADLIDGRLAFLRAGKQKQAVLALDIAS